MPSAPEFIIVGAPKCGTTSLYHYLQQHPQIFMPANKEPRFFCNYPVEQFEFGIKQFHPGIVTDAECYSALFSGTSDEAISGEASTDYLSTPGTAERIYAWNPQSRIIIMLRNPVLRAYSEYRHAFAAKFQTQTFAESLSMEAERHKEGYDPIFAHVRRGLYYEGVKHYLEVFGCDQVHIIFIEDFEQKPAETLEAVFAFLGLPPINIDATARHNSDTARMAPPKRQGLARQLGKIFGPRLMDRLFPLPAPERPTLRDELNREEYGTLQAAFTEDIAKLSALLNVDLSRWQVAYDDLPSVQQPLSSNRS